MSLLTTVLKIRPVPSSRRGGVLAHMIRLWIEHHQRMLDYGIRPF